MVTAAMALFALATITTLGWWRAGEMIFAAQAKGGEWVRFLRENEVLTKICVTLLTLGLPFFAAMAFLLPSRDSAMPAESLSRDDFNVFKSTGGFGNLVFPFNPVTTAVPRDTTSVSAAPLNPSTARIGFGFGVDMFFSLFMVCGFGGALCLTRLLACYIYAVARPNAV